MDRIGTHTDLGSPIFSFCVLLQSTISEEKGEVSEGKQKKLDQLKAQSKIDPLLETQFQAGRLYASIASRPGQSGRADGYILEGKELEFYVRRRASSLPLCLAVAFAQV